MRRTIALLFLASLASGCAYHAPDAPTPVTVPPPSSAPASIRLTAAQRTDQQTDVVATVLTIDGHFVADTAVTFSATAGTFTAATIVVSDTNGVARTILANSGAATVSASAGALQASVSVISAITPGPPLPLPPPAPPTPPTPAPTPTPTINAPTSATVGASVLFGISAPSLGQTFAWTFGDGGSGQAASTITHTYTTAGTYIVRVTAPGYNPASSTIIILDAPTPAPTPTNVYTATIGCTPATHGTATSCNVSATYNGVTIPSAAITTVAWDYGDGQTQVLATPTTLHTYAVAGSYTVYANVTAGTFDGLRAITVAKVVVIP